MLHLAQPLFIFPLLFSTLLLASPFGIPQPPSSLSSSSSSLSANSTDLQDDNHRGPTCHKVPSRDYRVYNPYTFCSPLLESIATGGGLDETLFWNQRAHAWVSPNRECTIRWDIDNIPLDFDAKISRRQLYYAAWSLKQVCWKFWHPAGVPVQGLPVVSGGRAELLSWGGKSHLNYELKMIPPVGDQAAEDVVES